MSTATLEPDTMSGVDMKIFESLAFEPALDCEHICHPTNDYGDHSDEGGRYEAVGHKQPCGCRDGEGQMILCEKFVEENRDGRFVCNDCGERYEFDQRYTIIERIK